MVEKLRTTPSAADEAPKSRAPKSRADADEPLDTDDLDAVWKRVTASAPSMMIRTLLEHARLASVAAGVARVVVAPGMRSLAEGRKGELEQLLSRHGGVQARIELEVAETSSAGEAGSAGPSERDEPRLPPGADDRVREHPLVKEAARVFGAGIAKVKPRPAAARPPSEEDEQRDRKDETDS